MPAAEENITKAESSASLVSSCRYWAASRLGGEGVGEAIRVEGIDGCVIEGPGGVEDGAQWVCLIDLGEQLL